MIGSKKISQIISDKGGSKIKFVNIFCYEKLYIDEDIFAPGINFNILSKKWAIIGNRKIVLKGLDGEPF